MTSTQRHNLRLQILVVLNQGGEFWTPESALFAHLNSVLGFAVSASEINDALEFLSDKAYVDFTVEQLTEEKRWRITAAGKTKLPCNGGSRCAAAARARTSNE